MPKRFIIVPERFRSHLEEAIEFTMRQAGSLSVQELYQSVKKHLARNDVPHRDNEMETDEVPADHAYWSLK